MPINIAVLIKQVPDTEAQVEVVEGGTSLKIEKKYALNFFDSLAVEEAIRLKEKFGGTVTSVTMGGDGDVEALRTSLAMGADRAVLLGDPAFQGSDGLGTACVLAAWVRNEDIQLILCGVRATDDEAGVVGPMVAECLEIPHAINVIQVEAAEDLTTVTVRREVNGGEEELCLPLPALLSAQKGLNEPRVPPIMGVMKAMKAPIEKKGLADLGLDSDQVGAAGSKTQILSYQSPPHRRPVQRLKGEGEEVASQLVKLLREEYKVI